MSNILFCNGCFDLMHAGHAHFLEYCMTYADHRNVDLVVAVDGDEKVRKDKGPNRPYFSQEKRAELVKQYCPEATVVVFNSNEELEELIKKYEPEFLVKGRKWEGNVVGAQYAKNLVFCESTLPISTTEIEQAIQNRTFITFNKLSVSAIVNVPFECTCSGKFEDGQWWHTTAACYGRKRL